MENWYDVSIEYIKKHIADKTDYDFIKKHLDHEKKLKEENNNLNKMREELTQYIRTKTILGMRCGKTLLTKYLNDMLKILEGVK